MTSATDKTTAPQASTDGSGVRPPTSNVVPTVGPLPEIAAAPTVVANVVCEQCEKPLESSAARLWLAGKFRLWHVECFVCCNCRKSLHNHWMYAKEQSVFCKRCFNLMYRNRCTQCSKPIQNDGSNVKAMDVRFHQHCFKCQTCGNVLWKSYAVSKNRPICVDCYQKQPETVDNSAERAVAFEKSRKPLSPDAVTARREPEQDILDRFDNLNY